MKAFDTLDQTNQHSNIIPYLKIFLGLILFVALISHNQLDPSPLNLLWPDEGVHNWLGLPGALVSGFLVEIFGWCGFLIPLFLLALSHKKTIRLRQAFFLDIAVIMMFTIGLAQLIMSPDAQLARLTGVLGLVSNFHLAQFPGKLITILVVAGFIIRYSKHYLFSLHFVVMMRQLGMVFFAVLVQLVGFGEKKLNKLDGRFKKRFSRLSTTLTQKMASLKQGGVQNWALFTKKFSSGLLEINPFQRLPSEKNGDKVLGPLIDEVSIELANRQLLKQTLEDFEKRTTPGAV